MEKSNSCFRYIRAKICQELKPWFPLLLLFYPLLNHTELCRETPRQQNYWHCGKPDGLTGIGRRNWSGLHTKNWLNQDSCLLRMCNLKLEKQSLRMLSIRKKKKKNQGCYFYQSTATVLINGTHSSTEAINTNSVVNRQQKSKTTLE